MTKGGLYYTDFHVDEGIMGICLDQLRKSFDGEIVSVSLGRSLGLGKNIVLDLERGYPAMVAQIVAGLEALEADQVFFLEHDVLYNSTHFDFEPPRDNVFYYNVNNYRWLYPEDYLITYSGLTSLSAMCCNRELALGHYKARTEHIEDFGLFKVRSKEPKWARLMGYEPGTKRKKRGGFSDDVHEKVRSAIPNIDIRHDRTFSSPKVHERDFKHLPPDLRRVAMADIPGWDLKGLFRL